MKTILVTGGKGQLASCIKDAAQHLENYKFIYVDLEELDIAKQIDVDVFFKDKNIAYCINCAAYTAVDKAETEHKIAKSVNEIGAKNLAEACKKNDAVLIQISTDFVFDGEQSMPYKESDKPNPISIYGITKLDGESAVIKVSEKYFIIRTSWLYSEYGNNFMKTMLKLGQERDELHVVNDQIGTPTYAGDLANVVVEIITSGSEEYGVYHYSNEGVASWFDFAKAIFAEADIKINLSPIITSQYPTPAKRPKYSVMDKSKIKDILKIEIPKWRNSLDKCLNKI